VLLNRTKVIARYLLDRTLAPLVRYCFFTVAGAKWHRDSLASELNSRAISEAADYVQDKMSNALSFRDKRELWRHSFSKKKPGHIIAEFGVWKGESINYLATLTNEVIFGFDSFEGLQEDWRGSTNRAAGHFSLGGHIPKVPKNVRIIKGWFNETLPHFLGEHPGNFSFVHIDSDTYEAAKFLLNELGPRLAQGTIIVFDEYFGYRGWRSGEFKAWQEFVESKGIQYEYLAFSESQVTIRLS
jgi:hypothetical protein